MSDADLGAVADLVNLDGAGLDEGGFLNAEEEGGAKAIGPAGCGCTGGASESASMGGEVPLTGAGTVKPLERKEERGARVCDRALEGPEM